MQKPRFRILAVEPDALSADRLRAILADRTVAEVVIADTAEEAVAALGVRVPDLLLVSAILPPLVEEQVMLHLKRLDPEGKVPILTLPPAAVAPEPEERGFLSFLRRPTPTRLLIPAYDSSALGDRIVEALQESQAARIDRQLRLVGGNECVAAPRPQAAPGDPTAMTVVRATPRARGRRAHRLTPADLPWPCTLTTPNGVDLKLLNVSRSGILIESAVKFAPDSSTDLYLSGPESRLVLPARFVRSEVGAVSAQGVRYHAAAVFSRKVDLFARLEEPEKRAAPSPQALAELLVRVTQELGDGETASNIRTSFEFGLKQLVPACEIRLRDEIAQPGRGCDSIYFKVPTSQGAILQATFNPEYEPAIEEFKLLRAAAAVAAVIVEYENVRPGHITRSA
jgi:CheY-like chemotaxis protein